MSSKSLYGQYIAEREGKHIIENEFGFATYFFTGEFCYIEEIFVLEPHRKSGIAAKYADEIAKEAKSVGVNKLLGSVSPKAPSSTQSLKVLLAYGFQLLSSEQNLIYLAKEI